ncbi:MAG: phosphate ABC transporter substrate-binding protein [Synergistaceae bacterium]|jgi:phosphate transport system substrate-binding protein|nr:phosphate ABC transporter substrate-binding protein [Synergistaceae bacterium]
MKRTGVLLAAAALLFGVFSGQALAGQIVVNGSTTVLPIAQAAAEAFMEAHPDVNISISGGGSGNGIKAIIDGTTDIANSSRFIKQSEVEAAVKNGAYPVPFAVAVDAIIPVVHPSNPVKDLTIEQLRDIYMGKITNWKELGGPDRRIAAVTRDTSSGTFEVWEEKVMNKEKIMPQAQVVASSGAMAQSVAGNPGAVGYIGIGYVDSSTKTVTVNGVEGTARNALNGSFPVSRYLFMFTPGWPEGEVMEFMNFILSDAGQKIVEESGFVPLR